MNENQLYILSEQNQIERILEINASTSRFDLSLTKEDAELLVQERKDCLREQKRIEFGEGILKSLILTFCDSSNIYQDNYVETIGRLQEIFYLYKNESMDEVTDDELLTYMRDCFDGICQGSLDYLEDTCLEEFARNIRRKTRKFIGRYVEHEE